MLTVAPAACLTQGFVFISANSCTHAHPHEPSLPFLLGAHFLLSVFFLFLFVFFGAVFFSLSIVAMSSGEEDEDLLGHPGAPPLLDPERDTWPRFAWPASAGTAWAITSPGGLSPLSES